MPLGRHGRIVAVRALPIQNHDLLKPEKLFGVHWVADSDLCAGGSAVSCSTLQVESHPASGGDVVSINLHLAMPVEAASVADDVEIAIAIDVTKTKPIIH